VTFETWMALLSIVYCDDVKEPCPAHAIDGRRRFALVKKGFIVEVDGTLRPTKKGLEARRID